MDTCNSNMTPHSSRSKKHKKNHRRSIHILAVLIIIFLFLSLSGKLIAATLPDPYVDVSDLYSPCSILTDMDSGKTLAKNNSDMIIYPASLTKIMTALIAIENTDDWDKEISMPSDFSSLYDAGASMAGFDPGEKVTARDVLYGIVLPSGAECCIAFANETAESEYAFVGMMNEKAEELGMHDTNFCNSTGLHHPSHYSTVSDISILLKYALSQKEFRDVFTCEEHVSQPTSIHPDGLFMESTLFSAMDDDSVTGGKILGGKTGYTGDAGLCLASLAKITGREYVLVTAKASGSPDDQPLHVYDALNVYDQIGNANISNNRLAALLQFLPTT